MTGTDARIARAVEPRIALVTGASSGIGRAIAVAFGALGWSVTLVARRADRLAETGRAVEAAGGKSLAIPCDVSDIRALDAAVAAAESQRGAPDVVVANAGAAVPGLLHETPIEDLDRQLRINLLHPLVLARRVLPGMLARGRGDLVFVSSDSAARPRAFQVAYGGAKRGLEGAVEALRAEIDGTGVRATIVRPGATGSEFGVGWAPEVVRRMLFAWKAAGVLRHLRVLPAESVARAVVHVVTAPPGTRIDTLEVQPEGPEDVRIP